MMKVAKNSKSGAPPKSYTLYYILHHTQIYTSKSLQIKHKRLTNLNKDLRIDQHVINYV